MKAINGDVICEVDVFLTDCYTRTNTVERFKGPPTWLQYFLYTMFDPSSRLLSYALRRFYPRWKQKMSMQPF